MGKTYSHLRERCGEEGRNSPRAAARRYEISESVAINGLSELNGMARESLVGPAISERC